jgi:ribose-phosphate pyrophosphokinase
MKQSLSRAKFTDEMAGQIAILPCRNGIETASAIIKHIHDIRRERSFRALSYLKKPAQIDTRDFDDGEIRPKIRESVRGKCVYIIQNTLDPRKPEQTSHNIMELLLTTDAVRRSDADEINLVLPYLSYSKQERSTGREPISVKVLLDAFQNLGIRRLFTMELHAPAVQGFVNYRIENLYASQIFQKYFLKEKKFKGVWVAPDPNAGKFVRHYSKVSGLPMAFGYKYRTADSMHDIEDLHLLGDIEGRDVAIIDDQSATSRTLLRAVSAAKDLGANKVYCAVTHAMFLGDAQEAFRAAVNKGLMEELVCTNTLMQPKEFLNRNRYIKVLDGLRLFAEAIFETYTGGSISRLYEAPLRDSLFGRS